MSEEQHREAGCPARELCREPLGRDTRFSPTPRARRGRSDACAASARGVPDCPTNARMPMKTASLKRSKARDCGSARHQPDNRLGPADGPDRSVKIPALVTLALGRRLDTRQLAQRAEEPDRSGEREVGPTSIESASDTTRPVTMATTSPVAVQDRERDRLRSTRTCSRHAGTAGWAGPRWKRMMYGRARTPGRRPRRPAIAAPDQDDPEPQRHAQIEPALEQIEGERARCDEEDEDPDRQVIDAVMEFVALADLALGGVTRVEPQGVILEVNS